MATIDLEAREKVLTAFLRVGSAEVQSCVTSGEMQSQSPGQSLGKSAR